MGSLYKRGNTWWLKYFRNGKPYRESSGTDKKMVAEQGFILPACYNALNVVTLNWRKVLQMEQSIGNWQR